MQRLKLPVIIVSAVLCLTAIAFTRRYKTLAHHSRVPISVDFCDLAEHREKFWDIEFTTSALVAHSLEGSQLTSPACPSAFLFYRLGKNSTTSQATAHSIYDPFGPDVWISFEGDLTMGSRREDNFHRLLRAFGSPTKSAGVVRVLKVETAGGPGGGEPSKPH